jgi:hypothetical protein
MANDFGFRIDNTPRYLYIGETKIDHHLVERIEYGTGVELHVRCNAIFEINQRIFFGLERDCFYSFSLLYTQYDSIDNYHIIKGEFDKCVCFPKSFLKEYCKYINIELYRDGKHSFIMSDSDYQYYKQCLENKEISKTNLPITKRCSNCQSFQTQGDKYPCITCSMDHSNWQAKDEEKMNCPHNYKQGNKYYCNHPNGYINEPKPCGSFVKCDLNRDRCNVFLTEQKQAEVNTEMSRYQTKKTAILGTTESNIDADNENLDLKPTITNTALIGNVVMAHACQCGYIEYGDAPNFCAKCGQRYKAPAPPFELTKPTLIDLDPVEVKQFNELEGFGLQDKLMIKRCAKCDSSHDFDWKDTKKFKCSEYKDYLIDVNLAKTKQCLCYNSKNRKVCPKCNHAFDAYSKGNTYKSEQECPFCHQYEYKQYRETHFSLGATLFTLIMWAIPLLLAIFVNIFALITYTITLSSWGITIGDCEGLGVFTTYEDKEQWVVKE